MDTTARRASIERRIARLYQEAADLDAAEQLAAALPDVDPFPAGTVLTFTKTSNADTAYLYAALKVNDRIWYLTGRRQEPKSWAELREFLTGKDSTRFTGLGPATDIKIATQWQPLADAITTQPNPIPAPLAGITGPDFIEVLSVVTGRSVDQINTALETHRRQQQAATEDAPF